MVRDWKARQERILRDPPKINSISNSYSTKEIQSWNKTRTRGRTKTHPTGREKSQRRSCYGTKKRKRSIVQIKDLNSQTDRTIARRVIWVYIFGLPRQTRSAESTQREGSNGRMDKDGTASRRVEKQKLLVWLSKDETVDLWVNRKDPVYF